MTNVTGRKEARLAGELNQTKDQARAVRLVSLYSFGICRDFSEFVGVSVKELVKAIGESRANGNGPTPPETPRRLSRSSSPKNPQGGSPRFHSPSSSPVPIPGTYTLFTRQNESLLYDKYIISLHLLFFSFF